MEFIGTSKILSYGKSVQQINRILKLEEKGKDFYQILCEFEPKYKKYSKSLIDKKISQFGYKNILKYIIDEEELFRKRVDFNILILIISEYSELSSYIYGGPTALKQTSSFWEKSTVDAECSKIARSAFNVSVISKMLSSFLFGRIIDKFYFQLEQQIKSAWDELSYPIEEYFKKH